MVSVLSPLIEHTSDLRIAVAFASRQGLKIIEAPLSTAVKKGAAVEFLVGLDMRSTEPEALQALLELSRKSANAALYCYASVSAPGIYHPKLYLSRTADAFASIVGSSNLTEGGLKKNVEVNVLIEADVSDEIVSDIYSTYNRLKFQPDRVAPDDEFLALYAQLCQREKEEQHKVVRDRSSRRLLRDFSEKAKSLRRPTPSRRDLVGWLELVYDALPEGEFTNRQVYEYEGEFQRHYPENLNVRAKVRQQLQVLRDMGFIQHVATGRWRKA
jgi:HKD family nuclease